VRIGSTKYTTRVTQTESDRRISVIKMDDENQFQALTALAEKYASVAYIKLLKNTKGYNWEIKQLSLDIEELEKLNNEMITKFGGVE
jgi:hypothetical protein